MVYGSKYDMVEVRGIFSGCVSVLEGNIFENEIFVVF